MTQINITHLIKKERYFSKSQVGEMVRKMLEELSDEKVQGNNTISRYVVATIAKENGVDI